MPVAAGFWIAAGAALALAVWSGLADRRRKRRSDPDRVGLVNWPTVQVFALLAVAILVSLALHLR